jgi:excisionase family DNA binding protein
MTDLLTPAQVAERLQVSLITVKRWLTAGKMPAYKIGRQWRISEEQLRSFIESNIQE